ncbi:pectate lyase [Flagelloscypha sp. PMI_526]|nr:pectate lyase [Flagelloscypha sp. PMI_526]
MRGLFVVFLLWAVSVLAATPTRVRINPSGVPPKDDPDYTLWTISNGGTSATITANGVTATLACSGSTLKGASYKTVLTRYEAYLGERLVAEGMSTDDTGGYALSLTLSGLAAGSHTLQTFHNAWDKLNATNPIDISVDGTTKISNLAQTVRQDNIWTAATGYLTFNVTSTSQKVVVTFTPRSGSLTDRRAFLNGFEIDVGNVKSQAKFPFPEHNNQHINADSGTLAMKWSAPSGVSSPTYTVYVGNSATSLSQVSSGTGTTYSLASVSSLKKYYWRVDVTASGVTTTGQTWYFRSRALAFPGAEGYGKYARGGRGGAVVKVTSLADSGTGTLRYALTNVTGPRTVVFDIGGVITLTSRLTISQSEITLAGQTAPGKGIAIIGWPMGVSGASDVVIQHMRVRPGKVSGETVDGMGLQGSNNCILDRSSMGWSIDESFSSRSAFNITFQRNMISEPLNVAGHQNYPAGTAHGYSASIGGDIGSFHHNLLAHAEGRSWSMAGGLDPDGNFTGRLDIRNNVVYNFGGRVTDGGAHQVNFVGNYYKPGAASTINYDLQATYEDSFPGTQTYYCATNMMSGKFNSTVTQWVESPGSSNPSVPCYPSISISPAPTYQKSYTSPFFDGLVETQSPTEAYKRVLSDSGASSPVQDDHDKRIVSETFKGTYTYKGSASGKPGLIDNEADCGGLESFPTTTRASTWDANNDGIADWWDGTTGGVTDWTAMDGYLAFMSDPHAFAKPSATVTIALAQLAAGFVSPTFTVSGTTKGTVSVSGSTATYVAGSTAGIDKITLAIKDTEGSTWTRYIGVAIWSGF